MTGAQLALQKLDGIHKNPKAKCPFVPQREMVRKLWGTDADPLAHKGEWEQRLLLRRREPFFFQTGSRAPAITTQRRSGTGGRRQRADDR